MIGFFGGLAGLCIVVLGIIITPFLAIAGVALLIYSMQYTVEHE